LGLRRRCCRHRRPWFDMDRMEIVDPRANGEAVFAAELRKWPAAEERATMSLTAGTENTLSRPSQCPDYGDHRRAIKSNYEILRKVYDQSYRILSSIEHHSILFGQDYVNSDECEPAGEIDPLERHPQLKLAVSLFYFRSIFIEILNVFNNTYRLGWEKQVAELRALQDEEYPLLRE